MRFYLLNLIGMGVFFIANANASNVIKQNFDLGCSVDKYERIFGDITAVHCLDEKFNDSTVLYLNEKLVAGSLSYLKKISVYEKIKDSDKMSEDINKDFLLFSGIEKNHKTKKEELKYFLFDFLSTNSKFYKFGISNQIVNDAQFYVEDNVFYAKFNSEIIFSLNKEKFFIPKKVIDKEKYTEKFVNLFDIKSYTDEEIFNTFSPFLYEEELNLADPLVSNKNSFEVYKRNANNEKVIKEVDTPLGKLELIDNFYVSLFLYPKNSPDTQIPLVHPYSTRHKFPGVLAVNSTNSLILSYLGYTDSCGKGLALIDTSRDDLNMISFGVSRGCDYLKSVNFIGDQEAIITLEPGLEFHYKKGKMTLPPVKDYKVVLPSKEIYLSSEDYNRELKGEFVNQEFQLKNSNKTQEDIYQEYPPYSREEEFPVFVGERIVFPTKNGEIMLQNFRDILEKNIKLLFSIMIILFILVLMHL